MKIAFISQPLDKVLPPSQNSIGIWVYEVARRLAQQGNEVFVYANGGLKPRAPVRQQNVQFTFVRATPYRYANRISNRLSRFRANDRPFFASPVYWSEYILQIALDLRRRQVELVHITNFSQFVPIVRALLPQARIVLHMQCEWLSQLDRRMVAGRIQKTDVVLGCSDYISQLVRDRFPEYADRCRTVWNGVNEQEFYPAPPDYPRHPPQLLFVSRLSPEKGVHILLRAFQLVAERFPNACLELIGSPGAVPYEYLVGMTQDHTIAGLREFYQNGSYYELLQKEVPQGMKDHVTFAGHIAHTIIPERFRAADILINPSLSEPFGMALVEGMATGIPVIAPRVGGMVEIIDNQQAGLLVNPNDPRGLADAILRLLSDPQLRQVMGSAGRQRVMDLFTWDRIVESFLTQVLIPKTNLQGNA